MDGTSGPSHMFTDRETTQYQVAIPSEEWERWKDTIPRTMPLYERIFTLIQLDTALGGEADIASLKLLQMKFGRLAERARTAQEALENGDTAKARAELSEIEELADELAGD